jgi:heptosyltransferase II
MNFSSLFKMNQDSYLSPDDPGADKSPILIVPYMWVGEFVRGHSVVTLLRERFPDRPVDMLATKLCAPLAGYMPGIRKTLVADLPRGHIALAQQLALARRLRREGYGDVLVLPRTWKSALAPFLAGIPRRTGFFGEGRVLLINDLRFGERQLPRTVDRCAALALPKNAAAPPAWPRPVLDVPADAIAAWQTKHGVAGNRPLVALAPGSVAPARRWPSASYAALSRRLLAEGCDVFVLGGPNEKTLAQEIVGDTRARDLTGNDIGDAVVALAAAAAAVANDSGLLHVAAALGTPSIGIFGPMTAAMWAPLNPLAAAVEINDRLPCRPCNQNVCPLGHHRCLRDISPDAVFAAARDALAAHATTPRVQG